MSTATQSQSLGATLSEGRVHFAVWAPFAERVEVVIDDSRLDLDRSRQQLVVCARAAMYSIHALSDAAYFETSVFTD